jgi:hypothetical protein
MSILLEKQNKNGKDLLVWKYKSLKDVDEVILQLLNEADLEGFIKSTMNREAGCITYDVTAYSSLASVNLDDISEDKWLAILNHFYRLLVYLEDSFIDIDYVVYNPDCIFVNPDEKRMYLVVLPTQLSFETEVTLSDCLEKIVSAIRPDKTIHPLNKDKALERISNGIQSLTDFHDVMEILQDKTSEKENTEDPWKILKSEVGEIETVEEATVFDLKLDDFFAKEDAKEQDDSLSALQQEILDESDNELQLQKIEDSDERLTSELPEADEELHAEVEAKVREELRAEVETKVREELRAEVEAKVREELCAEVEEKVREELQQTVKPNTLESKIPYLVRTKNGEIIPLKRGTFIIGKMETCCDYVVTDNKSMSRLHAVIKYMDTTDEYYIADCNSTNHIYLNGKLIKDDELVRLVDQMHIHLATEEFVFYI